MNIKFEYLYRDAGNNKKWGEVIFTNHHNINVPQIDLKIRDVLIDREFFVAGKSKLPELKFQTHDTDLDHDWYEFATVEYTVEKANDKYGRDIAEFVTTLSQAAYM